MNNLIDAVDIEAVEKNVEAEELMLGEEKILPKEKKEKKGETLKKLNSVLDARRRIEDMTELKKMRQSLDYFHDI